jgi:flavin-dependent dehydrogenase
VVRRGGWPQRYAIVAHVEGVPMGARGEMFVASDGYVGLADVGGGVTNVAAVFPVGTMQGAAGSADTRLAAWIAAQPRVAARLRGGRLLAPPRVTGPFNHRVRRAWAPGAALVGDAADFLDPFTGEGIYAALRGAQRLLPYAFDACRARDGTRQRHALEAWERARRETFAGKWRVERLIAAAVAFPRLFNLVGRRLAHRPDLADLLVGVAGDFVPPRQVLRPGFLLSLLAGREPSRPGVLPSPDRLS